MTASDIFEHVKAKKSFACIGLDTDTNKIPRFLLSDTDPMFSFNKAIIDATASYAVAFKPNIAFYEAVGEKGWQSLAKTVNHIRQNYPDVFIIADAKRGDIGNTSEMYAHTFFKTYDFDAVTLSPYMGKDTVAPFLEFKNKWSILLALTSNTSAADFQLIKEQESGKPLYQKVIETSRNWGTADNIMYVVGATKAEMLKQIREIIPNHFLLVPGVGAQGGSLEEVSQYGMNKQCGLLVNSSRAILYANNTEKFAAAAEAAAFDLKSQMEVILKNKGLI